MIIQKLQTNFGEEYFFKIYSKGILLLCFKFVERDSSVQVIVQNISLITHNQFMFFCEQLEQKYIPGYPYGLRFTLGAYHQFDSHMPRMFIGPGNGDEYVVLCGDNDDKNFYFNKVKMFFNTLHDVNLHDIKTEWIKLL